MRPPAKRPCRRTGFTLVEVLAALALVAIILPVAMRGISLAVAAGGDAVRRMEAASLAEVRLKDLIVTGDWRESDLSGDFGPDRPLYRWSAAVDDWEDETLRQVTLQVEWTAGFETRVVSLTTLVYVGSQ